MLKIKKTKPYQFRKSRGDSAHKIYMGRVACAMTLICSIVPTLALLTYYNPYAEKTYAADKSLSDINDMQEMTTDICNNSFLGETNTLPDVRDYSTYTIARLSDGNCWMTQNLRLTKEGILANKDSVVLSNTASDVPDNNTFAMPDSSTDGFSGIMAANVYYGGDTDYGAYYTWCAATASGCATATTNGAQSKSSICPKGWRLPTSEEFQTLYDKYLTTNYTTLNGKRGRWLGAASASAGGAFFFAAGFFHNGTADYANDRACYWSSTAVSNSSDAGSLGFDELDFYTSTPIPRSYGLSVRCLAPAPVLIFLTRNPTILTRKTSTSSPSSSHQLSVSMPFLA